MWRRSGAAEVKGHPSATQPTKMKVIVSTGHAPEAEPAYQELQKKRHFRNKNKSDKVMRVMENFERSKFFLKTRGEENELKLKTQKM